jgi:hypothetical protein
VLARIRGNYSAVVSTVALFVALGGTSYAVTQITGRQIKDGTITARDVKQHSLSAESFKAGQLPVGAQGPQGAPGDRGASGPSGAKGDIGANGATGAQGAKGDQGLAGVSGSNGAQGLKGDTGANGADGHDGIVNATRFQLGSIVNQPNGQIRSVITTTGLAPGQYLVTFSVLMTAVQRYDCGVQYGGPSGGYGVVVRKMISSGGNPEELQGAGIMQVYSGSSNTPILTCLGYTADWSASNIEVDFIKLDSVTTGTNG